MSDLSSERPSNASEYSIRRDSNGWQYHDYHSRNPHTAASTRREHDDTTPRSERRSRQPSGSVVTGASRHDGPAGSGQGRGRPIVSQTPAQFSSTAQLPVPISGSSPPLPGQFELSKSRHAGATSLDTPYPPDAFGYMASVLPVQGSLRSSQPEFVSSLTGVAFAFATIEAGDYKNCEKYMRANPELFKVEPEIFLKEAFEALKAGKDAYAKCCVQQSLLLRDCRGESMASRMEYFDRLLSNSDKIRRPAVREFLIDRDEAIKKLKEKLHDPSKDLPAAVGSLSLQNRQQRHDHAVPPSGLSFSPTAPRYPQPQAAGRGDGQRGGVEILSNAPTYSGEMIDDRYVVQPSSFFTVGRVFAILWHTNIGGSSRQHNQQTLSKDLRSGMMQTGRFGELIISHIQRLVVVKKEHGFCWCIPVNTYSGKGVAKKGFTKSDRAAHAIIYMDDQSPYQAPDETDISKRPIMIIPAGDDQKLDPMSRLNFAKVHTVEQNVRVMSVGRVDPRSLPYFEGYWEAKAKESFRKR